MLAVCMFYGWPALLTFGFSGNLALYYLCWIAVIIPYLSQINFFFFFFSLQLEAYSHSQYQSSNMKNVFRHKLQTNYLLSSTLNCKYKMLICRICYRFSRYSVHSSVCRPCSGWPLSIFVMKFGIRKLESGATRWWTNHDGSLAFFVLIQYRRLTDGQTRCSGKDPR